MGGGEGSVGLITYMRTDAPVISRDAQEAARNYIVRNYGAEFYPPKPNVFRSGEKAQEAHEAIRPTDVNRTPASLVNVLDPQELKLYDLIWRRFVASQMANAKFNQRTVLFDAQAQTKAASDSYTFSATATDVVFPGFMKVMELDVRKLISMPDGKDTETQDDEDEDIEVKLPKLDSGEKLKTESLMSDQKATKPPARYSEAMLIDALEKNGIGRPSTYATIMETIIKHNYVTRERKTLIPTELGQNVIDILVAKLPNLFNVGFTAEMETDLDKVEDGEMTWIALMDEFYGRFKTWMDGTKDPPAETASVQKLIVALNEVKEWLPAEKRGRRTYDDNKLVTSIREQLEEAQKPISQRQQSALASMVWRYRAQISGAEELLKSLGLEEVIKTENPETPKETVEKIELILTAVLSDNQRRFITSLQNQIKSGRNLSPKQVAAADRIFETILTTLENKEEVAEKFKVEVVEAEAEADEESPVLLASLARITEWKEPVKRGRRVFDDAEFYKSVKDQFERKGALSVKQRAAMQKMIARYKDQIGE